LHLKSVGVYFQTEDIKRTITTNRNTTSSIWRNMQWYECLRFPLLIAYQNWNNVGCCGLHFSSCILCDNVFWFTIYSFHIYRFIRSTKYKLKWTILQR